MQAAGLSSKQLSWKLLFYLLVRSTTRMISANILDVFIWWRNTFWQFCFYAFIHRLNMIIFNFFLCFLTTYSLLVLFCALKGTSFFCIPCPSISSKVILWNKPISWISDNIDICWLSQSMSCKVEMKMMFQQEEWFLKTVQCEVIYDIYSIWYTLFLYKLARQLGPGWLSIAFEHSLGSIDVGNGPSLTFVTNIVNLSPI